MLAMLNVQLRYGSQTVGEYECQIILCKEQATSHAYLRHRDQQVSGDQPVSTATSKLTVWRGVKRNEETAIVSAPEGFHWHRWA
jgi:hypothetical protein